jgi:hypothetical protein
MRHTAKTQNDLATSLIVAALLQPYLQGEQSLARKSPAISIICVSPGVL